MKELDGLLFIPLVFNVVCVSRTMLVFAVLAQMLSAEKEALCLLEACTRFIHQLVTLLHLATDRFRFGMIVSVSWTHDPRSSNLLVVGSLLLELLEMLLPLATSVN